MTPPEFEFAVTWAGVCFPASLALAAAAAFWLLPRLRLVAPPKEPKPQQPDAVHTAPVREIRRPA